MEPEKLTGWGRPEGSRKHHYFNGSDISLCDVHAGFTGPFEDPDVEPLDYQACAVCLKKRRQLLIPGRHKKKVPTQEVIIALRDAEKLKFEAARKGFLKGEIGAWEYNMYVGRLSMAEEFVRDFKFKGTGK